MAKRQNFVVGSTNAVTETMTTSELNHGFDRYEVLTADKLDGTLNSVSDYSNDSSNEIANAIESITGAQPTGATQTELANALQQMRNEIETTSLTFKGYVATSAPSSSTYALIEGNLWINSATMPTSFPVAASSIKQWNGTSWVNYGSTYTPADFDFFRNINDNEGYYWFGGMWTVMSTDMSTTYFTLNQSTGKWEIKSSVNLPGSPTTTTPDSADQSTKIATTQFAHDFGQRYVTNCITEIPQDINLELNSGTLTLKAGSKYYLPDGTQQQTTADRSGSFGSNGQRFVYVNESGYLSVGATISGTSSGATDSLAGVAYHYWFDTANNVINGYAADGTTVNRTFSLPIAMVTVSGGAISSIDKVFNGLGYIGSTIFALPGVKGLIPDGRNADGTLKNTVFTVSNVLTNSDTAARTNHDIRLRGTGLGFGTMDYDSINNFNFGGQPSTVRDFASVGKFSSTTGGAITSFNPKPVFHAVDYNEFEEVKIATSLVDLFDFKWTDHIISNPHWVRATAEGYTNTGAHSAEDCPRAYAHLVADIQGKTLQTETVGGQTVSFYRANDGHKICPVSELTNTHLLSVYAATGTMWYYVLDTTNQRFWLPNTMYGTVAGVQTNVGNYVAPTLPNITAQFKTSGYNQDGSGAITYTQVSTGARGWDGSGAPNGRWDFSANTANSIYQNDATVQPPAIEMYLYFFVG